MPDPKAKLLYEWDHGHDRFRLIGRAKWTSGYEDEYLIEKLGKDGFGEPRWDHFIRWKPDDNRSMTLLVSAIKQLLQEGQGGLLEGETEGMSWGL